MVWPDWNPASFVGDKAKVGAFLLSVPVGVPDIVATSAYCKSAMRRCR